MRTFLSIITFFASMSLFAQLKQPGQELIAETFEEGITAKVSKMISDEGMVSIIDSSTLPAAGAASEGSRKALVFEESGDSYESSYKPAMDFELTLPKGDGTLSVVFKFKQMSGDGSGLSVDLIQKTPSYGCWARIYLGKDLTKLMVTGSEANTSILPANITFSNGPEATWHTVAMALTRKGDSLSLRVKIDDVEVANPPLFKLGNPTAIQTLRFSDEGSGPDTYLIDNLKVVFTPLWP